MKTKSLNQPIKLRNRISPSEIYYTFATWPTKFIEGVEFIAVNKNVPTPAQTQPIHFVRKDSLEKVK